MVGRPSKCPRCGGTVHQDEQRFCGECGFVLTQVSAPPAPSPRFCASCGQPLVGDGKFCGACGTAQPADPAPPGGAPPIVPVPSAFQQVASPAAPAVGPSAVPTPFPNPIPAAPALPPASWPPPSSLPPVQAAPRPTGGGAKVLAGVLFVVLAAGAAAAVYYFHFRPGASQVADGDAARGESGTSGSSQEAAAERKRRFDALVDEAKASVEKDPAAALKKLEEAEDVAAGGVPDAAARVRPLKDRALLLIALESKDPGKARDDFVGEANDPGRQRKLSQGAEDVFEGALKLAKEGGKGPK